MKNILGLSLENVVLDFFVSFLLILLTLLLPSSTIKMTLSSFTISQKLLVVFLTLVFSLLFYYPFSAALVYLSRSIKDSFYDWRELIFALVLIIFLNPFAISFALSKMFQGALLKQDSVPFIGGCGITVSEIYDFSKVGKAGLAKGDVIKEINGNKVNSVQDVATLLTGKKPGDRLLAQTNKGERVLELVGNPEEPTFPALGIYVEPAPCQ